MPTIANIAATLAATASQVASPATTEFSSTVRLTISSTYRAMCSSAATKSTAIVVIRVARSAHIDGP